MVDEHEDEHQHQHRWLRHPKPSPCWNGHKVWATVCCLQCPGYSEPYGENGRATGKVWRRGRFVRIHAIHNSKCGDYVSALTECGNWINVWCRWNVNAHALIGANLCCITEEVVVVDEEEKKVAEKTDNSKV